MAKAFVDKDGKIYQAFDRFDFEQQIMSCWNVTTDLKDLNEAVLDTDMTKNQIANVLMGVEQLYNLRFEKLFRQFEQLVREYHPQMDKQDNHD
jgi:hypothetical protein